MKLISMAILIVAAAFSLQVEAQTRCASEEYQQFDFWVGEWDVYDAEGNKVGENTISKEFGGCALHEQYRNMGGYQGASYNIYDASRGVWL